ncbi:Response regulators consisting of a CheY-like receiver domain and a winged-helix DNA-binding domain [Alteromonadaceae bacterium Bs31]|nr:Response regulators consisting of a CheY-like receiver domain and a winged-helix DNA-binding domain [Alteromonadaceae bacterium Bs31]
MNSQKVVLLVSEQASKLGDHVARHFYAEKVSSVDSVVHCLASGQFGVVVFDSVYGGKTDLDTCRILLQAEEMTSVPLIVLTQEYSLQDKLKAYEIGCDDFIDTSISPEEACARVTKSIYNQIATHQLKSRLDAASHTAHSAMADNSDLGANIQFLLAVHECDNLDQLGQQLFNTLQRYGLSCSLQMRSILGDKDMEAHGMAKDLESQLLAQLAEDGRYIDFGARTIVNYDRVSLLIKNMPLDEEEKYGAIKDNTFSLLQGLNARILALEGQHRLEEEKEALRKMSEDVTHVMNSIKDSYQTVMCDIVNEVEYVAELIQMKVPTLAITEENEIFLESATARAIANTNKIFNDGLVVDECFAKLELAIERSLHNVELAAPNKKSKPDEAGHKPVELF